MLMDEGGGKGGGKGGGASAEADGSGAWRHIPCDPLAFNVSGVLSLLGARFLYSELAFFTRSSLAHPLPPPLSFQACVCAQTHRRVFTR